MGKETRFTQGVRAPKRINVRMYSIERVLPLVDSTLADTGAPVNDDAENAEHDTQQSDRAKHRATDFMVAVVAMSHSDNGRSIQQVLH
jgi:hypothetical protein